MVLGRRGWEHTTDQADFMDMDAFTRDSRFNVSP